MRKSRWSNIAATGAAALMLVAAQASHAASYAPDPDGRAVMLMPAPPVLRYRGKDGAELAYRRFEPPPGTPATGVVAILMHGSGGSSRNMTVLGEALARAGTPVFAPDVRGQGLSGRRGDIDYIGQLDDDLSAFVAVVRQSYPSARLVLVGHSSGGGFVLRVAGESLGRQFSRFVLLSPYLGRFSPSDRPDGGWARPHMASIVALTALNGLGVSGLNGTPVLDFAVPPDADALGLTTHWSYRMMVNYGPRGTVQLGGSPCYLEDASHAPAPVVLFAGTADKLFRADRYAAAFARAARPVSVNLVDGVSHMGIVSDPRAAPRIVEAIDAPFDASVSPR